jgi:hypothetical protein
MSNSIAINIEVNHIIHIIRFHFQTPILNSNPFIKILSYIIFIKLYLLYLIMNVQLKNQDDLLVFLSR